MTQLKRRQPSSHQRPTKSRVRRVSVLTVAMVLAVGVFATIVLFRGGELGGTGSPLPSPQAPGVYSASTAVASSSAFQALHGRWPRHPGCRGYSRRQAGASGTIDAVYLNPRPITIARAEATRAGSKLQVFVELRAPGYPGSTYTLTYDPMRDQLAGNYFQAALQQRFDIVFVRMQ